MVNDHEGRISLKIVYNSQIIAFFKTLPQYCYIEARKEWSFPVTELKKIKEFIDHDCGIHLVINSSPDIAFPILEHNPENVTFTNEPFRVKIKLRYDVHATKLFQSLPGSLFCPIANQWIFPNSELAYIELLCQNMSTVVLVIESHEKALIKHVNTRRLRVSWPYNFNMWELFIGRYDVVCLNERTMECSASARDSIVTYFEENNVKFYEVYADDDISDNELLVD
jgi:hypothetical protein